jgi:pimeloyl-ACP methyl ester carboxylesterase
MRRLALVSIAVALLIPAGADAAKPRPEVVAGAAHRGGGRVSGWFVVEGRRAKPHGTRAYVLVNNSKGASTIESWTVPRLRAGERRRFVVSARLPTKLGTGPWRINACKGGNCLRLGQFQIRGASGEAPHPTSGADKNSGSPSPSPSTPISTIPTDPIHYVAGEPFEVSDPSARYWAFVPTSYDASNLTATPLLIWLHGCGGESSGDVWVVDPGADEEPQDWLTIAPAEREGECWAPSVDEAKVMAALADFETHFNVDRRRVILGGYSSGGDLAYRTGFRHSSTFAGLLIENSSPFRDTESSAAESLAAATTKLHIVHLAHLQDGTYPIAGVRSETNAVKAAGFPLTLIERPGEHYDANTYADLRTYLLPHIDDGWLAPSP